MGVLGVIPFLQKTCPKVIKQLPDRLKGFAGKTLVIDGTLITQRLHFAAMPHKYRHVLGWYKLIEELRESDVNAICVFDGKQRSKAKAREVARRKDATRLTALRGTLEAQRSDRLRKLTTVYGQFQLLSPQDQSFASQALYSNRRELDAFPDVIISPEDVQRGKPLQMLDEMIPTIQEQEETNVESSTSQVPVTSSKAKATSARTRQQAVVSPYPTYRRRTDEPQAFSGGLDITLEDFTDTTPSDGISSREDHSGFEPSLDDLTLVSSPDAEQDIASLLVSLFSDYTKTVSEIIQLSKSLPDLSSGTVSDYVMTKAQLDLSAEEGRFWDQLMTSAQSTTSITTMASKSTLMSESFDRRTHLPTSQTYDECKSIISAMGIPCVDVEGEYEAEALASSMVINGLADYVASEDTDVLVYEAPLLRNITNRQGPLTLVSGSEVREVLALSGNSFLDFALLLGTDFTRRIKNIGPSRAYKFIREHGSIENVIKRESKYPPHEPLQMYLEQIEVAREVFRTLPPVPDTTLLVQKEENRAKVQELLKQYRIEKVVDEWDSGVALAGNYFQDKPGTLDIDTGRDNQ